MSLAENIRTCIPCKNSWQKHSARPIASRAKKATARQNRHRQASLQLDGSLIPSASYDVPAAVAPRTRPVSEQSGTLQAGTEMAPQIRPASRTSVSSSTSGAENELTCQYSLVPSKHAGCPWHRSLTSQAPVHIPWQRHHQFFAPLSSRHHSNGPFPANKPPSDNSLRHPLVPGALRPQSGFLFRTIWQGGSTWDSTRPTSVPCLSRPCVDFPLVGRRGPTRR